MTDPRQNDQNKPNAQGQHETQQNQTQAQHNPQGQQPTKPEQGEPSFEEQRLAVEGGATAGKQPDPRQGEQNTRTNPGGQATG